MRIVVDGFALQGTSVSIVTEHLLAAWTRAFPDDDLHVALAPDAGVPTPPSITRHVYSLGRRRALGRLHRQNVTLPRLCRALRADVVLAPVPSTAVTPLPCPRVLVHHDLQHELRPQNFGRGLRIVRGAAYSLSFRQAAAISCISAQSRADLLRSRPYLRGRDVRVVHHGSDHVERLRALRRPGGYAIAFGQYRNKNVELVLRAWRELGPDAPPLHVVGLADRAAVADRAAELGVGHLVTALPWLSGAEFEREFADADLVVFVSDYEGFGLPAVEAMRLGVPVVIGPEPAVLEATAGRVAPAADWTPAAVAAAVRQAHAQPAEELAAARDHALTLTWERSAAQLRDLLRDVVGAGG